MCLCLCLCLCLPPVPRFGLVPSCIHTTCGFCTRSKWSPRPAPESPLLSAASLCQAVNCRAVKQTVIHANRSNQLELARGTCKRILLRTSIGTLNPPTTNRRTINYSIYCSSNGFSACASCLLSVRNSFRVTARRTHSLEWSVLEVVIPVLHTVWNICSFHQKTKTLTKTQISKV